jgi:hypothetical protein
MVDILSTVSLLAYFNLEETVSLMFRAGEPADGEGDGGRRGCGHRYQRGQAVGSQDPGCGPYLQGLYF